MTAIRTIQVDDAVNFLALRKKLDEEPQFLMYEPGERNTTPEEQRKQIKKNSLYVSGRYGDECYMAKLL